MNRRGFIGALLGTAAATALPSEIWPFRKIFVPTWAGTSVERPPIGTWIGPEKAWALYPEGVEPFPGIIESEFSRQLTAVEMEIFKEQMDRFFKPSPLYELMKRKENVRLWKKLTEGEARTATGSTIPMRVPMEYVVKEVDYVERSITIEALQRRKLIHAPATPENIMEFIDGLESDLSKS